MNKFSVVLASVLCFVKYIICPNNIGHQNVYRSTFSCSVLKEILSKLDTSPRPSA